MKQDRDLLKENEALKKKVTALENERNAAIEKADASDHIKELFLTNISHEIRTPMNGIIGMYNVLKQTELSEEQREFLDIINISGQNLLSIIDDIIDLSKIESGQLKFKINDFSLESEIDRVIKLASVKARGKGIRLHKIIDESVSSYLKGDATRLRQIITNLVNNAIKYTKEGSVTIKAKSITGNNKQETIYVSVTDTGIGISQEGISSLFKAFSQLDTTITRSYGGTGLGLAIAKNLSNLMGGDIGVESKEGKGSTFWFTAKFEKGSPIYKDKTEVIPVEEKKEDLNILLVEDNLLNQKFAVATLRREGHTVDIAENGKVAVEKYKNNDYDLILMDIQMPVMDGIEASQEIRKYEKLNNITEPIKIIAITAYVMEKDRSMCLNAGMDEYLAKPFKPQELIDLIDQVYYRK